VPRYRLTIAYDGTDFCGWQKQEPRADAQPRPHTPMDQTPAPLDRLGGRRLRESLRAPRIDPWANAEPLPARDEGESGGGETGGVEGGGVKSGVVKSVGGGGGRVALRTVQHVVERAVIAVVRQPVTLVGASRTDSGVHARGQVAAFTCEGDEVHPVGEGAEIAPNAPPNVAPTRVPRGSGWPASRGGDRLRRALNSCLPDDVQVVEASIAPDDFDPIAGAVRKSYSYTFHAAGAGVRALRPLWDRRYVTCVLDDLDAARMHDAAQELVGTHDFAAFAAAGHGRLSTVRTIESCVVREVVSAMGEKRVRVDVVGSGFLWNMVRIIAGTLCQVGRGQRDRASVAAALASRDRARAGPTAPPTGLCLEWIAYDRAQALPPIPPTQPAPTPPAPISDPTRT
jgi:tRNA pseudouridine38-40 synthase